MYYDIFSNHFITTFPLNMRVKNSKNNRSLMRQSYDKNQK